MEPLIVLLLFVVAAVVIGALVSKSRTRRSNLEAVARRYKGVVTTGWLSGSDLEMTVDGVPAQLSYHAGSKNSPPHTRLRFKAPLGARLRVVPDGFWETLKKAFWSEDLTIGDPRFDKTYVIQGHPASWVRHVLDDAARARIDRLSSLGTGFLRGPSITLEAGPSGVLVAVPRNLVDDLPSLEAFIAEAVELFRALRNPPEEGVTFISTEEIVAEGSCPVCEHPLGDAPRLCATCATPHHGECWTYFGGCSTYACKENP